MTNVTADFRCLCHLVADARERRLRSTASRTCVVTRTYSTFGDRAFRAAGPGLWNSLPSHLKDADISYSEFRRSLKTLLFGQWGHGAVWTVLTAQSRNILTYFTYLLIVRHLHTEMTRISSMPRWTQIYIHSSCPVILTSTTQLATPHVWTVPRISGYAG